MRWRNSFEAFITDVGKRPGPGYSIDRKDNDGDYAPGNVRWATRVEQMNNTRKQSRKCQKPGTRVGTIMSVTSPDSK